MCRREEAFVAPAFHKFVQAPPQRRHFDWVSILVQVVQLIWVIRYVIVFDHFNIVIELAINRVLCIVNGAQALVGIILSIASCRKISVV
jgi:hypothetical protein